MAGFSHVKAGKTHNKGTPEGKVLEKEAEANVSKSEGKKQEII